VGQTHVGNDCASLDILSNAGVDMGINETPGKITSVLLTSASLQASNPSAFTRPHAGEGESSRLMKHAVGLFL